MSERSLRDEIERLSTQVKQARAQVAHNQSVADSEVVRALRAQVEAARERRDELARQVRLAEARVEDDERSLSTLRAKLDDARAGIARLDPPENPWARDAPNWGAEKKQWDNQEQFGCLQGLVLLWGGFLLGAAAGWLA